MPGAAMSAPARRHDADDIPIGSHAGPSTSSVISGSPPPRRCGRVEATELIDEGISFGEQFAAELVGRDLQLGTDLGEASENLIHSLISSVVGLVG